MHIFDRFECQTIDDDVSYAWCIKSQKDGMRTECRNCPDGQRYRDYFKRQYDEQKKGKQEAPKDMGVKKCPKCDKDAVSNNSSSCEGCGHVFEKKAKAPKKEPKPKKERPAKAPKSEAPAAAKEMKKWADDAAKKPEAVQVTFICVSKEEALKLVDHAMEMGALPSAMEWV